MYGDDSGLQNQRVAQVTVTGPGPLQDGLGIVAEQR